MATVQSLKPVTRHILGDTAVRFYDTIVNSGDTLALGPLADILYIGVTQISGTAAAITATPNPNSQFVTFTFAGGGTLELLVEVITRVG